MSTAVLSKQQMQQELEAENPARLLYNPSNSWLVPRYDAHPYPLCPDGEALDLATGEYRTTDGVTAIRDRYGMEWAEDPETRRRFQTGNRAMFASSLNIVKHIILTFPWVARLTGDPKKDDAIKAAAKKSWVQHRVKWASEVIAGRNAYLREFHAAPSNAGQVPDPMSALENEAFEFMASYRIGDIGRKTFVCKHDGYQTDDERKWKTHQTAYHAAEADGGKVETGAATTKKGKGN